MILDDQAHRLLENMQSYAQISQMQSLMSEQVKNYAELLRECEADNINKICDMIETLSDGMNTLAEMIIQCGRQVERDMKGMLSASNNGPIQHHPV